MKKYTFNEDFFETIDSEEKAYWLGFMAADGCISLTNDLYPRISLKLSEKDLDHLEKFKYSIKGNFKIHEINSIKCGKSYSIDLSSKKMYNDLLDKGITPRKSLTLLPPKNVPDDLIRHWIRGYFDGDGCFSFRKSGVFNLSILGTFEVLNFINSFLFFNKLKIIHPKQYRGNTYVIRTNKKQLVIDFYQSLYTNTQICLNRKFNLIQKFRRKSSHFMIKRH